MHCASVQTKLTNLHPPPYRSSQISYLSHSESVPLPLRNSSGQSLISYMPGRALHPYALVDRSSVSLTQSPFPFPFTTAAAQPLSATCRALPLHHLHACRLSCTHLRTLCDVHGLFSSALDHKHFTSALRRFDEHWNTKQQNARLLQLNSAALCRNSRAARQTVRNHQRHNPDTRPTH
jgi:hypothetical protein